ncbi:MAG TPA: geranylgeranylglycerol-phosphate geranylgeranyltransferase [Chitinophagales bacterium]|nr:geranylgeranylglycerol-phosphate geranylgeranyltransferase [Chitinophagales bacterium]
MNYIKLIRPINILFIIFIMILFRYAFVLPNFYKVYDFSSELSTFQFILLLLVTVFTAASGYVINDIYDSDIDLVNKPQKVIIDKTIGVDDAYNFYKILALITILLSVTLTISTKNYGLATIPILILVALNFYAQIFKKLFLIGNLIIALFSAMVILLPALYESKTNLDTPKIVIDIKSGILTAAICYALFAFFTTFIREIVKDMQDIEGDKQYGCKTVPIVLGSTKSKILISVIAIFLLLFIFSFAQFFPSLNIQYIHLYIDIILILPFIFIIALLWWGKTNNHYRLVSGALKTYMLIGVCTMFYFVYVSGAASYLFVQYANFIKKIF